jgi:hypothetical protein
MREDTRPETPLAKSSSDPPPAPDAWQRPKSGSAKQLSDALFANGARLDWGFGSGKVRTLRASGPAGKAMAIIVLLAIGALISLFFVFAIGFGTVVAVGAGAAAVLGLGAKWVRRRLTSARPNELGPGDR